MGNDDAVAFGSADPGSNVWGEVIVCFITHIPFVWTSAVLFRRGFPFECVSALFTTIFSFMYHYCEIADTAIILRPLQWHRLDNITAISSFMNICYHLTLFEKAETRNYIYFLSFFVVMILQEGYPWDERYTAGPVLFAVPFPIISLLLYPQKRAFLNLRRVAIGVFVTLLSALFFIRGLDDKTDPLRIFHGMFHLLVGVGVYIMWSGIKYQRAQKTDDATRISSTSVIFRA
ncbi:hypothetical protein STCU_00015 [Strigomonas culicis]|uniref:Uncharacterized protein n=1 Tax=Strigomonas culicis TaxID=28005 RepID=S9V2F3_9TRYP|nr:hypothetical protein STCU_06788 [Strigomonas culicis]EPY37282.1 hypothetical protein STCU_00015 [Strigomonas culicis]|eukprot:EPY25209.1 hypothetical protein STCU_06788 [Strigomonas culicis]